jgi:hypothetical protein
MMKSRSVRPISYALVISAVHATVARAQCSMCQASLANAEGGFGVISGFRQGIGLLLGAIVILGVIGWAFVSRARVEFELGTLTSDEGRFVTRSNSPQDHARIR